MSLSNCGQDVVPINASLPCGLFDHDSVGLLPSPFDFSLDVAKQLEPAPFNGPTCAICFPPFSGEIGSGNEILGKAICDGSRC